MSQEIKLDLGHVKVHRHVIEDIIAKSLEGIKGVHLLPPSLFHKMLGLFSDPSRPGINIRVDENQDIILDIMVHVSHGTSIPDVGRLIQDIVKQDIKKTLDVTVKDINVDIEALKGG